MLNIAVNYSFPMFLVNLFSVISYLLILFCLFVCLRLYYMFSVKVLFICRDADHFTLICYLKSNVIAGLSLTLKNIF